MCNTNIRVEVRGRGKGRARAKARARDRDTARSRARLGHRPSLDLILDRLCPNGFGMAGGIRHCAG